MMAKLTNNDKSTRYYSGRQERAVKDLVGGKLSANSGAAMFATSDVYDDLFAYECKTVTKPQKSFSLKKSWLEDNELERLQLHKQFGAVVIQFEPDGENYFVLSEKTFKKLLDKYREE